MQGYGDYDIITLYLDNLNTPRCYSKNWRTILNIAGYEFLLQLMKKKIAILIENASSKFCQFVKYWSKYVAGMKKICSELKQSLHLFSSKLCHLIPTLSFFQASQSMTSIILLGNKPGWQHKSICRFIEPNGKIRTVTCKFLCFSDSLNKYESIAGCIKTNHLQYVWRIICFW